ncbi:MAG TPA: hypothetical protein ENJ57_04390, partial [Rhizobiales bacterium]|nr:hypothetical protein [Hyphomicrobiales bacterium]
MSARAAAAARRSISRPILSGEGIPKARLSCRRASGAGPVPPDPSPPRQEADPDQRDVIAFLSNPETYPAAHGPVKRLDTHGAMVFLSGERAIKIKKPVAFSYMDFSTLEKRRRAITREYEINAPHAPTLYLKVLPITREPSGQLALGGKGEVVEWALIMRRFRQSRLLSAMADDGGLERDLMTRLARVIARLHQSAPAHLTARPLKALKTRIEHNEQACRNYPEFFEETRIDALFSRFHEILEQRAGDFNKRGEEGFVRRCHGDLHLRNMVLLAGEPVLFDAIEFDEEIATIDIL